MNFFGYNLGASYPPPLDYPDFYTENLKPISKCKLNKDIKIQLSTDGNPDFLISIINVEMHTLNKEDIDLLYNNLIKQLKKEGFEVDVGLTMGGTFQQRFKHGKYEGHMYCDIYPNRGLDGQYMLLFMIKDSSLKSKSLFEQDCISK